MVDRICLNRSHRIGVCYCERICIGHSVRSEQPAAVLVPVKTGSSAFGLGMTLIAEGRTHG
jgi:hypothetical protein